MMKTFVNRLSLLACMMLVALGGWASEQEGMTPLFNGENLDGWVQHGGEAEYTVEDGMIVGTSVPNTPNSFLCTEQTYSDFILELDFKVDDGLNSGVQIRSNVYDEPITVTWQDDEGETHDRTISAGRVHGYQVEIDPSDRAWSGGIYDEGRRGWLDNLAGDANQEAREAFKNGEWNHFRIVAQGDSIKTWINGVPAADLTDDMTPEGFIALQVHGIGDNEERIGKQVRWKNIRIKELD